MAHQHETILRQWQMLRHIPRYPYKITARVLKEKLSVDGFVISKRTIERDLIQLSLSFPLYQDDRDKQYGWSWQKDAPSFDLPGLGNNEALTMVMVEQYLSELLPSSTVDVLKPYFIAAHKQLNSNLKSTNIKSWLNKVRTVQPNQTLISPKVNLEIQKVITDGLLFDKQLKIKYRNRDGEIKEYRIHLLGLVQRGGVIYLNVRINDFEDIRMLVMHRIESAELLDEATQYPKAYDLDKEVSKGSFDFGNGEIITLKAKFSSEAGKHLLETPLSNDQSLVVLNDGGFSLTATLASTPQLNWWLLALGCGVEVLEPLELRTHIYSVLKKAVQLYQ